MAKLLVLTDEIQNVDFGVEADFIKLEKAPSIELLRRARTYGAVFVLGNNFWQVTATLAKNFDLKSKISFARDIKIVQSVSYDAPLCGFRQSFESGREAYSELVVRELEVERSARVAYELAKDKLIVADIPEIKALSSLIRKVVSEVNEDYPYISVSTCSLAQLLLSATKGKVEGDILAFTPTASELEKFFNPVACAYLSDDAFGVYGGDPKAVLPFMLKNSFDL